MLNYKFVFFFLPFLLFVNLNAAEIESDTLRIYRLGDINVGSTRHVGSVVNSTINEIKYFELQRADMFSLAEIQKQIPSARIRTNSRGEAMLFLRGAGERQLGLFFDGVPMNLPWDNRFDLSMLPVGIIGNIFVNQNANSIMFGPNVLGGVVNVSTIERHSDGYGLNAKLQGSNSETYSFDLTHDARIGDFNYIANISYLNSNGSILSGNAPDELLHQDLDAKFRTNTDQKRMSGYLRGEYQFSPLTVAGVSVLYLTGEKGVAPEAHIESARFWRYPEWSRMLISSNFEHQFSKSGNSILRGTLWFDDFSQQINTYNSTKFDTITAVQNDKDNTIGARLAFFQKLTKNQNLNLVVNGFHTKHEEIIDEKAPDNFSQNTMNAGIEYNIEMNNMKIGIGGAYDYNETPETGLFAEYAGLSSSDYAAFVNANYDLTSEMMLFANLSRRTRFPTMRESFSGALNRFKVNPDLLPESGLLTEIGFGYSISDLTLKLSGFANFYENLISQVTLSAEEDELRRRMRVNVGKAEIIGTELGFDWAISSNIKLSGFLTYMSAKGENNGEELEHLDNKPELLGGLSAIYTHNSGISFMIETESTGNQYEADNSEESGFAKVDGSTIFNLRISYNLFKLTGYVADIYVRANNIFDTYRVYQRGLPEPGRTIQAGISFSL
jgi:iron complex outermembrane receptor protein